MRSYFRAGWLSDQKISNRVAGESWKQDGEKYTKNITFIVTLTFFIAFVLFIVNLGRVRVYEFAGPNIKGPCGQPEPQFVIEIYPGKSVETADYNSFGRQEVKTMIPTVNSKISKIRLQSFLNVLFFFEN